MLQLNPSSADAAAPAGSGTACYAGIPEACACDTRGPANDVKCSPATVPGAICCASGQDNSCECSSEFGCQKASGSATCSCGKYASGEASCTPPLGGKCCLAADKSRCSCGTLPRCGEGEVEVSECTKASIVNSCTPGKTQVSACR